MIIQASNSYERQVFRLSGRKQYILVELQEDIEEHAISRIADEFLEDYPAIKNAQVVYDDGFGHFVTAAPDN